jgi:hypothetical protein
MDNQARFVALSLGWGVQSFTLAAMAALGELPMPNVAIHADTMHEFSLTYKYRDIYTSWLEERGLRVVVAMHEKNNIIDKWGGVQLPVFTQTPKGAGQIRRQCTHEWKIRPMRQYLQVNRDGKPVEMWLGISTDEILRMRTSDVKYITNRYPLIEKNMNRNDCKRWLISHNLEIPPKSACVFCPYHNTEEWRHIKAILNDWQEAISIDRAIRKARPPYELFIHPSRKPLEEVDFRTLEEMGQMRLWDEECTGLCGI